MKKLILAFILCLSGFADPFAIPPATPSALNAASNALTAPVEAIVAISDPTFASAASTVGGAASWRKKYIACNYCSGFYLHYIGAYTFSGSFNNAYFTTTLKSAIQLASAAGAPIGRNFQVTYTANGSAASATGTIPLGAYDLKSDWIPLPLVPGQIFFVTTYTPTTTIPVNSYVGNDTGESYYSGDATTTTPPTFDNTQQGAVSVGPACITSMIPKNKMRGVMLMGDSIAQLSNQDYTTFTNGWAQKGLLLTAPAANPWIPVVNTAVGGSRAIGQTNTVEYFLCYYPALKGWVRSVIYEAGFNDFYSDGATDTAVEAAATWTWAQLRGMGISNLVACTVKPGTTSTDGWLTVANQTARSGDNYRNLYNTWLTNQVGLAGGIDGLFDLAASLCSSTNISLLAVGPATVLGTDTAGTGTVTTAIRTSAAGVGSLTWAGAEIALVHSGTTYYGQIVSYRPGTPNRLGLADALTAAASGDTYTVYQAWCGDTAGSGAHPDGYGVAQIASQWPSNLTTILIR